MKKSYDSEKIIKVNSLKKADIRVIRFLIGCGLVTMFIFITWFFKAENNGYGPLYWALTFALLFKLLKMVQEWYHYWSPSIPVRPEQKTKFSADILTTACPGEPKEMIIRTLEAMVAIRYPHTNYLCDEGNDPELKKKCEELGVIHVTRVKKVNAKAGNINNALQQATGDICVILDPDHVPIPEFLDRVMPYFEDADVGYVQSVQAYGNQEESFIARGAAEQTYSFYGPMMMNMNTYGTVQAIGANCAFRRKALDSIGGHAPGLAEDMHTAMQLHAKGWRSLYIPEILTRGLVPATLSAYYKQQLKWSRGTFELLFRVYPSLFKNLTWKQRMHYLGGPLYFLFGLVNLFDIVVPLLALFLAEVPWEVNLGDFASLFVPLCSLSLIIRLFAQRWLLEKHERGLHLAGGLLRMATWWIFLVGFIYSIFNINVPYIPTPKEDERANYWRLCMPNFAVVIICVLMIIYGLYIDWTPYSIAMAAYGLINAGILGLISLLSQQKLLDYISQKVQAISIFSVIYSKASRAFSTSRDFLFSFLRFGPVFLIAGIGMVFLSYSNIQSEETLAEKMPEKFFGGFYLGMDQQSADAIPVTYFEKKLERNMDVLPLNEHMHENDLQLKNSIQQIANKGYMPVVRWQLPWDGNKSDWQGIDNGKYDRCLMQYADIFRSCGSPLFIVPVLPYKNEQQSPETVRKAWQHLYTFFNNLGISNLTWVWEPPSTGYNAFYPGPQFVDWVGVKILNYAGEREDKGWYSFKEFYKPYRKDLGDFQKSVMITEMGCVAGKDQSQWFASAFENMRTEFPEIRSALLFSGEKYHFNFSLDPENLSTLKEKITSDRFEERPFITRMQKNSSAYSYLSPYVKGKPGHFNLVIKNKTWYIRGVAYNTAHDWRDGNMPLTRRQLEKDLQHIKEMGANAIRRYDHGMYDRNVLNVAEEYGLKVLYGFWFDPKVDYYRDTMRIKEYFEEMEKKVLQYRDHPSVLAWSLGNETWGLLKHRFAKPYLIKVRDCYIKMLEQMARRIHELDPTRPVFACMEHEEYQLPGEIVAFHDGAPSIDVLGINSYYKEQISRLNHVCYQFDSLRPYLISEFGPRGYWDPHYNRVLGGARIEDTDVEKADWYKQQWTNYVDAYKGYNVGGFAYCWHDRMEGSYTWFGLTDYKGRPKRSYFALKEIWTRQKQKMLPSFTIRQPEKMVPGKEYEFEAVASTSRKDLKYEWLLLKDEYLDRVDNVEYNAEEAVAKVKIPTRASAYRLYLFVSDKENNVTTASVPIPVK